MPYDFPVDASGRAGAVKAIRDGNDFIVPTLDIIGTMALLTSAALAANATYTGPTVDRLSGSMLESRVRIYTDSNVASAVGGLIVEESHDGVAFALIGAGVSTVAATLADTGWRTLTRRYWRVRYANGATAQTRMSIYESRDTTIDDVAVTGPVVLGAGGQVREFAPQFVDSVAALAAAATFTGLSRDLGTPFVNAANVRVRAFADQAGTLVIEQSRDNVTFRNPAAHSFAVAAGETVQVQVPVVARFVRVRYVNGATAQTAFELISHLGSVG